MATFLRMIKLIDLLRPLFWNAIKVIGLMDLARNYACKIAIGRTQIMNHLVNVRKPQKSSHPICRSFGLTNSYSFKGMSCPTLEPFPDGTMNVTDLFVNTTVAYTCDPGFMLTDGTRTRTCQGNLKWSGKAPICRSKRLKIAQFKPLVYQVRFQIFYCFHSRNPFQIRGFNS